jgi:hypothetical protein
MKWTLALAVCVAVVSACGPSPEPTGAVGSVDAPQVTAILEVLHARLGLTPAQSRGGEDPVRVLQDVAGEWYFQRPRRAVIVGSWIVGVSGAGETPNDARIVTTLWLGVGDSGLTEVVVWYLARAP